MPKKDWKSNLKKLTYTKGVDVFKMEKRPYHDWRIVVVSFFVLLSFSVGFNVYMSLQINKDSFFAVAQKATGVVRFNEEGLAAVVKLLDEKAALFEKVMAEGVGVVDPSL